MCLEVTSRHTGHIQSWETHRPACHRLDRSKPSDFKFITSNSTECCANLVACLICVTANCFCDNSWSGFVPRIHTGVDDFFGFRWTASSFPCLGKRLIFRFCVSVVYTFFSFGGGPGAGVEVLGAGPPDLEAGPPEK